MKVLIELQDGELKVAEVEGNNDAFWTYNPANVGKAVYLDELGYNNADLQVDKTFSNFFACFGMYGITNDGCVFGRRKNDRGKLLNKQGDWQKVSTNYNGVAWLTKGNFVYPYADTLFSIYPWTKTLFSNQVLSECLSDFKLTFLEDSKYSVLQLPNGETYLVVEQQQEDYKLVPYIIYAHRKSNEAILLKITEGFKVVWKSGKQLILKVKKD